MSAYRVVEVEELVHDYAGHPALRGVGFDVRDGEIFGLLGPNGGGKTTLFRILSTILQPSGGVARIMGHDVVREPHAVRERIGVVFQSPAVDRKLTVRENLTIHGRLYGLNGATLRDAIDRMLRTVGLEGRAGERAETLSGGLLRRVEIAKGLLHKPPLLLLDEPSTGLDPAARNDLWDHLDRLRSNDGVTVLMTTHLMEEAERCDRIGILHEGRLVALGTPHDLKGEIGGDVIVIATPSPDGLCGDLERRFGWSAAVVDGTVRVERPQGHEWIPRIVEAFRDRIEAISLGRPTLLDVFIHKTGHRFWGGGSKP
ncbi:MAG: ATP-binding cassette domain-containing protein [Acidobacteria bacterium]|nr:ATP-binding cassette domain-containing protein [Acidobacteriota bacterium]